MSNYSLLPYVDSHMLPAVLPTEVVIRRGLPPPALLIILPVFGQEVHRFLSTIIYSMPSR
jgi:hypothetical protein